MKRCILPTLFFFVCTFSYPVQARAAVPLAILAASAIGATMAASATGSYYAKTGQAPEYVSAVAGAAASASDFFFQPSFLAYGPLSIVTAASFPNQVNAYIGKEAAIGATVQSVVDAALIAGSGVYDSLKSYIQSHQSPASFPALPSDAVVLGYDGVKYKVGGSWTYTQWSSYFENAAVSPLWYEGGTRVNLNTGRAYIAKQEGGNTYIRPVTTVNASTPLTHQPAPGTLNYANLKSGYGASSAAVKDDVRKVIRDLPAGQVVKADAVPTSGSGSPPVALTPADLQAAIAANTAAVAQKALEAAQAIATANPNDAAAQIAAQQAAVEAAKAAQQAAAEEVKPQEETFAGINSQAFEQAYNPGEYDIQARFESFLDTVKSSGLFSFSSGFFNSLPGGGSPIFTINGGQTFGTHTIDFSQTMTAGLAVLKSILLACFGFLSIRAVIMKR